MAVASKDGAHKRDHVERVLVVGSRCELDLDQQESMGSNVRAQQRVVDPAEFKASKCSSRLQNSVCFLKDVWYRGAVSNTKRNGI